MSSKHHTLDIANRIEATMHVWKQKLHSKHTHNGKVIKPGSKSSWGKMKDLVGDVERRELLADRAKKSSTILEAKVSWLVTDRFGHEQDPVQ